MAGTDADLINPKTRMIISNIENLINETFQATITNQNVPFIAVLTENMLTINDYKDLFSNKCRFTDHCIFFGDEGNEAQEKKRV